MAPSFSGVWNISTQYQYASGWPVDVGLLPRTLIAGGYTGAEAFTNVVAEIKIANIGNAIDFGDLTLARSNFAGGGSDTRAVFAGGYGNNFSVYSDVIDYKAFSSSGNLSDFGNLSVGRAEVHTIGNNNVRLAFAGGFTGSNSDVIDYITIASTGNATDFGNLSAATYGTGNGVASSATRGLAMGRLSANEIQYITIASAGNTTDFGDLSVQRSQAGQLSSSTRAVAGGGNDGSNSNVIDYVTISSTSNATDFGDLTVARYRIAGASNSTRGIFAGGTSATTDVIDYVTIASTGNALDFGDLTHTVQVATAASAEHPAVQNESYFAPAAMGLFFGGDYSTESNIEQTTISYIDIATTGSLAMFGDLSAPRDRMVGGFASSTRGGVMGGQGADNSTNVDIIEYVLFSTKGKATDFGNLTSATDNISSTSNSTRGLAAGGVVSSNTDTIEYITIASAGNATDFGNLLAAKQGVSATSGTTRAIFAADTSGTYNVIQYVTIASAGNATDFGDLSDTRGSNTASASSTRAVFAGGIDGVSGSAENVIDYVTIASTGNATDFGDLTVTGYNLGGVSSGTRAVFGLRARDASTNVMDYITIASTGNATDWGDWWGSYTNEDTRASASNSHGGIA